MRETGIDNLETPVVRPCSRSVLRSRLALVLAAIGWSAPNVHALDVSAPATIQFFESTSLNTQRRAADLFMTGYGGIWVPPAGRADINDYSVGYDQYDRFDMGTADHPTLYGTENTYKNAVAELRKAGLTTYADITLNHNGFDTYQTAGFAASGGYPGFVAADFHSTSIDVNTDPINGRISNLLDIAQESNNVYIRQPVTADSRNIPAGTTAQFGRLANQVNASNRRFYQDRSGTPDRSINGTPVYDFDNDTSVTGTPVTENATGYLMRYAQWMVQVVGVDGFRLDATKHFPTWVLDSYFDPAVSGANRRLNLDGSVKNVFSFGEDFDTDLATLQAHTNKSVNGDLVHNRDTLDFPLYYAMQSNLTSNGINNDWSRVVNASFDVHDDGLANNGSQGVAFVQSADSGPPDLGNVAYAYTLMRPGNAIVYYNAKNFDAGRSFPNDGRGDALGGLYGDTIDKLVDIRNTHGRGNYAERWLSKEDLVYERQKSAIIALSNRSDNGVDNVTVQTSFPSGTRLIEMTGNATDPSVDPTNVISDYVTVDAAGKINFNIPRNHNVNGVATNKGYVIYGLPTPVGTLSIPDKSRTVAGGTANSAYTNGTTRLASLDVVTGDTFTINLVTTNVVIGGYTDVAAGGSAAYFSINGGKKPDGSGNDLNGDGQVDFRNPADPLTYGFEQFKLNNSPLVGGGPGGTAGSGIYRQVIDATKLVEGYNYLEVRAFRSVAAGDPAVYTDFKDVVYVDRVAATSALSTIVNVGGNDRALRIAQADATADNVHAFLDIPTGLTDAQVLALINGGSGSSQIDTGLWSKTFSNVGNGNHTLTLVTYEPSGRATVQRQAGLSIPTGRGLGLGDVNYDGVLSPTDVTGTGSFDTYLYSRGALFNAAADLNADGVIDDRDLFALPARFTAAGANSSTTAALNSAFTRRGNVNGDAVTDSTDIDYLYSQLGKTSGDTWLLDLNVDGAINQADVDVLVKNLLFTAYGDTNLDRKVNFSDLLVLAKNYGAAGTWSGGDFDGTGVVDFGDLLLLAKNYNFGAGSPTSATLDDASPAFRSDWALAQAVAPEPSVLSLGVSVAGLLARRHRRTARWSNC